ncbi:MAG: hypothetical protein KJ604_19970 [Gammaproteobacteria bacterium]|nr:hypothetical protein [Gammaproteobacteria bacterium]
MKIEMSPALKAEIHRVFSEYGRIGGTKSRRVLTPDQARKTVAARWKKYREQKKKKGGGV